MKPLIKVFSSARWPTKLLHTNKYFRRPLKPTKILMLFSSALKKPTKIIVLFSSATWADENVDIFSSANMADENTIIFVGNRRKNAYFRRLYFVGLFSSVGRRK
jgi:hypothetical protein